MYNAEEGRKWKSLMELWEDLNHCKWEKMKKLSRERSASFEFGQFY